MVFLPSLAIQWNPKLSFPFLSPISCSAESKNARDHREGDVKELQSKEVSLLLGKTLWIYVSMYLCAWMFKFGNINTHACLKAFGTTSSTFLPLTYRGMLRDMRINSLRNLEDFRYNMTKESANAVVHLALWIYSRYITACSMSVCVCIF